MRKSQFFLVAVIAPIVAAGLCLAARTAPSHAAPSKADEAQFRAGLEAGFSKNSGARMLHAIRETFPEEYRQFEDKIVHGYMSDQLTRADANNLIYTFIQTLSRKHMPNLAHAAKEDLIALAAAELEVVRDLKRTDAVACYTIAEKGGLSQAQSAKIAPSIQDKMVDMGVAEIRGFKSGAAPTRSYAPLSAQDWKAIGKRYRELGGDPVWLRSQADPTALGKLSDQTRCNGGVALLEAATTQDPDITTRYMAAIFAATAGK